MSTRVIEGLEIVLDRRLSGLRGLLRRDWHTLPAEPSDALIAATCYANDILAAVREYQETEAELAHNRTTPICRGCDKPLDRTLTGVADGCPCNSPRGINHGLVPTYVCTCVVCDPAQTGSVRNAGTTPAGQGPSSEETK